MNANQSSRNRKYCLNEFIHSLVMGVVIVSLAACGGGGGGGGDNNDGEGGTGTDPDRVVNPDGPSSVGFISESWYINENAGTATISVNRSGDSSAAISVNYSTLGITATPELDYVDTAGTLTWEVNDTEPKDITVQINSDSEQEEPETIELQLSDAVDTQLGLAVATLTIEDAPPVACVTLEPTDITQNTTLTAPCYNVDEQRRRLNDELVAARNNPNITQKEMADLIAKDKDLKAIEEAMDPNTDLTVRMVVVKQPYKRNKDTGQLELDDPVITEYDVSEVKNL